MRTIRDEDDADSGVAFDPVTVLRASAKAMLVELPDGEEQWVPHSCVHDDSEVFVDEDQAVQGSPGKLVIKTWFAKKEGLV